jgi:hypothetical protein
MWFWPVNEMIELVSGMPAPQFGDKSSSVRGSELVQSSSGSCVTLIKMKHKNRLNFEPALNLRECEVQRWFKVQAVLVFHFG